MSSGNPGFIPDVPVDRQTQSANDRLVVAVNVDRVAGGGTGDRMVSAGGSWRVVELRAIKRTV